MVFRRGSYLLWVTGIVIFFTSVGITQDLKQGLRAAQELERSGRLEEARKIYEELYRRVPENVVVFHRLKDLYLNLRAYDEAMELIEERRENHPEDPSLEVYAAHVLYKKGRQDEARARWQHVLDRYPISVPVYRGVASAMIRERLLDEAVDVYLLARKQTGKKDLFVFDLANLHGARMDYGSATEELLNYLETHPNRFSIVETQLLRYPRTDRVVGEVVNRLKKAISSRPEDTGLRRILVSVYLRAGLYGDGFRATRELERWAAEREQGEALFRFGEETFRSGVPGEAEKAYREILEHYPRFSPKEKVIFGLAQCYEAQGRFREAVEMCWRVFGEFKRSALARQALYRRGVIQRDALFDLSGADETFQVLVEHFPSTREAEDGRFELGVCAVVRGDLNRARTIFQEALEKLRKEGRSTWVRALVHLADAAYLDGRFEDVLSLLEELSSEKLKPEETRDPTMNDGLKLRLFVEEHFRRSPEVLSLLARAEFWQRQRNYTQALIDLDSLLTGWPDDPIAAHGLFRRGEIEVRMERYPESLASFDTLLARFPKILLADQALERIGWVYEKTGKKKRAVEKYETLLVAYPHSFLVDEVRRRIRRIEEEK